MKIKKKWILFTVRDTHSHYLLVRTGPVHTRRLANSFLFLSRPANYPFGSVENQPCPKPPTRPYLTVSTLQTKISFNPQPPFLVAFQTVSAQPFSSTFAPLNRKGETTTTTNEKKISQWSCGSPSVARYTLPAREHSPPVRTHPRRARRHHRTPSGAAAQTIGSDPTSPRSGR